MPPRLTPRQALILISGQKNRPALSAEPISIASRLLLRHSGGTYFNFYQPAFDHQILDFNKERTGLFDSHLFRKLRVALVETRKIETVLTTQQRP